MSCKVHIIILIFFLSSCKVKEPSIEALLTHDVPILIKSLATISQDSMSLAFEQLIKALHYKRDSFSFVRRPGVLQASSPIKQGHSLLDGQATVFADNLQLEPDKFGISFIAYPLPANDTLYKLVSSMLPTFAIKNEYGNYVWSVNGWTLEVKGGSIIYYHPPYIIMDSLHQNIPYKLVKHISVEEP